MILKAKKTQYQFKSSFMIGDQQSDEICAKKSKKLIFFIKRTTYSKMSKKFLKN